jgi:hypothetical protein
VWLGYHLLLYLLLKHDKVSNPPVIKRKESAGNRFVSGVVLYDGEVTTSFGDKLYPVPIRSL